MARVEQVMIDPKDGRVTFVVLSFVDREGSLAIPWSALMVQERGQLHLPKDVAQLENTVHLHESPLSRTGSAGDDGPISEFVPEYDRPLDDQPETSLAQNEPGVLVGLVVGIVTAPLRGEDPVVLLLLDTGLQQVPVALGLKRDLEAARLSVTPGEQVRVYGSRSTVQGRDLFRAKEIQIGAQTLELGTLFPDAQSN